MIENVVKIGHIDVSLFVIFEAFRSRRDVLFLHLFYCPRVFLLSEVNTLFKVDKRYVSSLRQWNSSYYIKTILEDIRKNLMTSKDNMKLAQPPEGASY